MNQYLNPYDLHAIESATIEARTNHVASLVNRDTLSDEIASLKARREQIEGGWRRGDDNATAAQWRGVLDEIERSRALHGAACSAVDTAKRKLVNNDFTLAEMASPVLADLYPGADIFIGPVEPTGPRERDKSTPLVTITQAAPSKIGAEHYRSEPNGVVSGALVINVFGPEWMRQLPSAGELDAALGAVALWGPNGTSIVDSAAPVRDSGHFSQRADVTVARAMPTVPPLPYGPDARAVARAVAEAAVQGTGVAALRLNDRRVTGKSEILHAEAEPSTFLAGSVKETVVRVTVRLTRRDATQPLVTGDVLPTLRTSLPGQFVSWGGRIKDVQTLTGGPVETDNGRFHVKTTLTVRHHEVGRDDIVLSSRAQEVGQV